ncbi:MAG: hypothetical protein IKI75_07040 [Lachnospiraceae bacterium]|nr:hypothetical protein [Lachnospiraceae bacterium]
MAIVTMNSVSPTLSEEEIREIERAETLPMFFDEDCPEMTDEMLKQFHRMDSVPVRISSENMAKIRAVGGNCAQILSRLLDLAINDTNLLRRCV